MILTVLAVAAVLPVTVGIAVPTTVGIVRARPYAARLARAWHTATYQPTHRGSRA